MALPLVTARGHALRPLRRVSRPPHHAQNRLRRNVIDASSGPQTPVVPRPARRGIPQP